MSSKSSATPITKTLSNGLRVLYVPYKNISSTYVSLMGGAGGDFEESDEVGVAHILEHCVFGGTQKYPSNRELSERIYNLGGYYNASTGFDSVEYYTKLLKEDMEAGFDFISQISMYPTLTAETLKREKTIIRQEALNGQDNELKKFGIARKRHYYPGQRYGLPLIGRLSDINSTNLTKVRNYHNQNYFAENFVLGVIGDVEEKKVFDLASKYFGEMPSGKLSPEPERKAIDGLDFYVRNSDQADQATLRLAFPAPKYLDPGMYPAKYLSIVLGGGFLARLVIRLRLELGFAYSVSAPYYRWTKQGNLYIKLKLDEKNLVPAIDIIKEEIQKIMHEEISEEEFIRTKKTILTGYLFAFEDPGNLLDFYMDQVLLNLFPKITVETISEGYKNVTKEDIKNVAVQIFSEKPRISLFAKKFSKQKLQSVWLR